MKFVIIASLLALTLGAPSHLEDVKPASSTTEVVAIMKDERVQDVDGRFSMEFEAANGIKVSQAGSPDANGAVMQAGEFSYTAPDGTPVVLKFVANENGFQPESNMLPVAPEFPHPIPQFVLDQIAFAAEEDARKAKEKSLNPSQTEQIAQ